MNAKHYTIIGLVIVVVAAGAFFGGYKIGQTKNSGQNFSGQRQFGQGQMGLNGKNVRQGNSGGMVNGEVISKDDKSITIKSGDGGSKIVFLSKDTQINIVKSASGTIADLNNNTSVMVNGTTNTDGSITAKLIQIRPNMPNQQAPGTPVKQQ